MDILEDVWKDKYKQYKQRLEHRIVSADAVRQNVSCNPGETFESICQKLKDRNIVVDGIRLSFAPELLDQYLSQSKKDGGRNSVVTYISMVEMALYIKIV